MKKAASFKLKVYKDQAVSANRGKIVEVGDTVTLVIRNELGAETTQDVVLTAVALGGKEIQWDLSTTGNLTSDSVVRVHQKHQYQVAASSDLTNTWRATLTESSPTTVAMGVTSVTFSGAVVAINEVEASAANGITTAFRDAVINKINAYLGGDGFAIGVITGTAGSQVLTITINGLKFTWDNITATGATVVQPAIVP